MPVPEGDVPDGKGDGAGGASGAGAGALRSLAIGFRITVVFLFQIVTTLSRLTKYPSTGILSFFPNP